MNQTAIPTLDMLRFDHDRSAFVRELGEAYEQWGFCCVINHGVSDELLARSYALFKQFFALPEAVKRQYIVPGSGGARGYTGMKVETAKDSQFPDLKEFWHVGRELPAGSKYREVMPENMDVPEVPGFLPAAYELYGALDALGVRMLRAMALRLNLDENFFDDKVNFGNSILRAIHYPPITQTDIPNVRAGQHEDINFITLLVGASAAGLEVLSRQNQWVPITSIPGAIVCNVGDMLQRLTNHVFPSTTHRVVNPKDAALARLPRYSIPFFLHPNPDYLIETLPSCITPQRPNRYPMPITSHDYLMERLREIKLI
jgi:isopenicillin N synthase-like dioxygenase